MKFIPFYKERLGCTTDDEVFSFFLDTLKPSNMLWSYFVNWDKVLSNTRAVEVSLHVLNYLIGKEDFDNEFRSLLKEHPEVIQVLPFLVVRDGEGSMRLKILVNYTAKRLVYEEYDFGKQDITDADIEGYLNFVEKTGVKNLLQSKLLTNLVDYVLGVEAGLDSNGRKNRGGHAMEEIVEVFVRDCCDKGGYRYLKEANAEKIAQEWGYQVPVDKSSRRYDYVVDTGASAVIIETNFYGGGGSKLKATAGEYRTLSDILANRHLFIWITDGYGWKSVARPLREAFDHNDYVVNLKMLEQGVLTELVKTA